MQKRKIDCHHYGLPAMLMLKNAIRMPLYFCDCTHYGLPAIFFFAKIDFSFGQDFVQNIRKVERQLKYACVDPKMGPQKVKRL